MADEDKQRIDELVRQYQLKAKRAYVPPPLGVDLSLVHREHGMSAGSDGALPDRLFTLGRTTVARQKFLGDAAVRAVVVRTAYRLYDQLLDLLVCRRPARRPAAAAESAPELLSFSRSLRSSASPSAAAAAAAAAADEDPDTQLRIQLIHDTDAQLRRLAELVATASGAPPAGRLPHTGLERACMPFAITYEDSGIGPPLFRHPQPRRRRPASPERRKLLKTKM